MSPELTTMVLSHLLDIVITISSPFILAFLYKGIKILEDKLKIQLKDQDEKLILDSVMKGISFVEQMIANAVSNKTAMPSADTKKTTAVDVAMGYLNTLNIKVDPTVVGNLVESVLGKSEKTRNILEQHRSKK